MKKLKPTKHMDLLSGSGESYRTLRTNLQFFLMDEGPKTVLITSAATNEEKTTVANNLAFVLQMLNQKTLLVDCDLRKPFQSKKSFFFNSKGLSDILRGTFSYEEALKKLTQSWAFIPSGEISSNPAEMLSSSKMKMFIEEVRSHFDWIIIDSPPILSFTDAQLLASMVEGVILVIAEGRPNFEVQRAIELLSNVKANLIGAVLNKVTDTKFSA